MNISRGDDESRDRREIGCRPSRQTSSDVAAAALLEQLGPGQSSAATIATFQAAARAILDQVWIESFLDKLAKLGVPAATLEEAGELVDLAFNLKRAEEVCGRRSLMMARGRQMTSNAVQIASFAQHGRIEVSNGCNAADG